MSSARLVLIVCGVGAWWYRGVILQWLNTSNQTLAIVMSGNIEAHQAVLGFKTVRSRIVELPFKQRMPGALIAIASIAGVPDGVDADRIEASFNKGVLTVTLPKTPEMQKKERRIEIKFRFPLLDPCTQSG